MSFDTLQINDLQHANKPVWEIFDWSGTDVSGTVIYANDVVNSIDYNHPNINNTVENILGASGAFGEGDDVSGNFGCIYYGNHPLESNTQFNAHGSFYPKVDAVYKISYHFTIKNVYEDNEALPNLYFSEYSPADYNNNSSLSLLYRVYGNNNANDRLDENFILSGTIVRRLGVNHFVRFVFWNNNKLIKVHLSSDLGYSSSGITITRM
tara:strand:+ start:5958 stop:6584 length:627 start_codon:yes stop_codon:yes gene_type:complete